MEAVATAREGDNFNTTISTEAEIVRRALVEWDMDTLLDLREQLDLDQLPPETILAIGRALAEGDRVDPAAQVLSRGAVLHPSNFLLQEINKLETSSFITAITFSRTKK